MFTVQIHKEIVCVIVLCEFGTKFVSTLVGKLTYLPLDIYSLHLHIKLEAPWN
jgi:hypothetical protein